MKRSSWYVTLLTLGAAGWVWTGCESPEYETGVVVGTPPPPVPVEVVPVAPGPDYVWIDGHWGWHNRWVWQPGYYAVRPHPHAMWRHGGWERGHGGWRYRDGHWR